MLKSLKTGKYYIGYTSDLKRRLEFHNSGRQRYTRSGVPWKLVYYEKFSSKREAIKREKQIKSYKGGNAFKKLIGDVGA